MVTEAEVMQGQTTTIIKKAAAVVAVAMATAVAVAAALATAAVAAAMAMAAATRQPWRRRQRCQWAKEAANVGLIQFA